MEILSDKTSGNTLKGTIKELMKDECIFMTGATGAVGSVLLEKLLRCCQELNTIYVLMRCKKGLSVQERLQKLLHLPLFSLVPATCISKIKPIEGDVSLHELGLDDCTRNELHERVGLVFHCAANVSFNSDLKNAVNSNLIGTQRILNLCQQMIRIKSLVYVSTAYSNFAMREVSERMYPASRDPHDVIKLVENASDEQLKVLTRKLCGTHPNTYTFSKQLAEHLLVKEHGNIPLAIVRPSIGTWKEPFPGWLQVGNGASGFIAGACKGVFRTTQASSEKIADFIPSDTVVNALILAAWSLSRPGSSTLQIYHVTSGASNPITWGEYTDHVIQGSRDYPCREVAWLPGAKCRDSIWRNQLAVRLFQIWPSHIVDLIEGSTSASHNRHKRESLVRVQQRFLRGMAVTHHFSRRQWMFNDGNLTKLAKTLHPEDRDTFNVEILELNWKEFFGTCIKEIRKNYFKDPMSTLKEAKGYMKRWKVIHTLSQVLLFFFIFTIFGQFLDGSTLIFSAILSTSFLLWL